jgi:DNA polymerase epsilon subunit 2
MAADDGCRLEFPCEPPPLPSPHLLGQMMDGLESSGMIPSMFVLIGNFTSMPFGQHDGDRDAFVRNLDALASIVLAHPSLAASSKFVFVPGQSDPGACGVLPRPPVRLP